MEKDTGVEPVQGVTRLQTVWNSPIFKNKQEAAVWAWMIDSAAYMPRRILTKFGIVELEPGEILYTERDLSQDFCMHRNTIRRLLQRMFDAGMIVASDRKLRHQAGTCALVNPNYADDMLVLERSAPYDMSTDMPSSPRVRKEVWDKTGGRCSYCNCELTTEAGPAQFHVDHVNPSSKGGKNRLENMKPSCRTCNIRKGSKRKFALKVGQIKDAGNLS